MTTYITPNRKAKHQTCKQTCGMIFGRAMFTGTDHKTRNGAVGECKVETQVERASHIRRPINSPLAGPSVTCKP